MERNVITGDTVYFQHPEHGVLSGHVEAAGKHGCTIRHEKGENGQMKVVWQDVLGHKERKQRKLVLLESGEDGHIALDEDGKRVFVRGEVPEKDDSLVKSLGNVLPLSDRVAIDAALLAAGYRPSIEYIRAAYGEHWVEPLGSDDATAV